MSREADEEEPIQPAEDDDDDSMAASSFSARRDSDTFAAELQRAALIRSVSTQGGDIAHSISSTIRWSLDTVNKRAQFQKLMYGGYGTYAGMTSDEEEVPHFPFTATPSTFTIPVLEATKQEDNEEFRRWLFSLLLDNEVATTLEEQGALNCVPQASTLSVLRTDGDGNCLSHAATLTLFGVHDRGYYLRACIEFTMLNAMSQLMSIYGQVLKREGLNHTLEEIQNQYMTLLHGLTDRRAYLESFHVFVLAQVLKRAIIVYGAKQVGEEAHLQDNTVCGIYLPTLHNHICESPKCPKNFHRVPIALCYSAGQYGRGHFAALALSDSQLPNPPLLPLGYMEGGQFRSLPIRFLTDAQLPQQQRLLDQYLFLQTLRDGSVCARIEPIECKKAHSLWKRYLQKARALFDAPNGVGDDGKEDVRAHATSQPPVATVAVAAVTLGGSALGGALAGLGDVEMSDDLRLAILLSLDQQSDTEQAAELYRSLSQEEAEPA
jgi:hypothetical protein